MECNLDRLEKNQVSLEVIATPQEVKEAVTAACRKVAQNLSVPGFRRGKIPRHILEQRVGRDYLYREAMEDLVARGYFQALQEHDLHPVTEPELDIAEKLEEDKPFVFKAKLEVLPEVKLADYKGMKVEKKVRQITGDRVEEELRFLQEQYAELVGAEKESLEKGDFAVIDFDGYVDGKPFPGGTGQGVTVEVGAGRFLPEFEEQLPGMKPGEEKEIKAVFPEDYPRPELAGREAVFQVKLQEIKVRELPELNDEFAASLGMGKTLDEMRQFLRDELQKRADQEAEREFERAVVEKVVDASEVLLTDTLVNRELDRLVHDFEHELAHRGIKLEQYLENREKSEEEFKKELRPTAEKRAKTELVLFSIADKEGITVTEEEINRQKEIFRPYLEKLSKRERPQREELIEDGIRSSLRKEKTVRFLISQVEPVIVKEEIIEDKEEKEKAVEK